MSPEDQHLLLTNQQVLTGRFGAQQGFHGRSRGRDRRLGSSQDLPRAGEAVFGTAIAGSGCRGPVDATGPPAGPVRFEGRGHARSRLMAQAGLCGARWRAIAGRDGHVPSAPARGRPEVSQGLGVRRSERARVLGVLAYRRAGGVSALSPRLPPGAERSPRCPLNRYHVTRNRGRPCRRRGLCARARRHEDHRPLREAREADAATGTLLVRLFAAYVDDDLSHDETAELLFEDATARPSDAYVAGFLEGAIAALEVAFAGPDEDHEDDEPLSGADGLMASLLEAPERPSVRS